MKVEIKKEIDLDIDYLMSLVHDTILDFLDDYDSELTDDYTVDEVKLELIRRMAVELAEKREKPSSVSVDREETKDLTNEDIIFLLNNCKSNGADTDCTLCPLQNECYYYFTGDKCGSRLEKADD